MSQDTPRIRILPDELANQIAAGEVVDRPASVVRELVDNAVDAEATDIRVWLRDGGTDLIRVCDDGIGMSSQDAATSFKRHATSKIQSSKDLFSIRSLGFRGEALPSIAAVAQIRMQTRVRGAEIGTEVLISGSALRSIKDCACSEGTDIEVSRLFFNTPGRRKFLRSSRYEEQRVREWLRNSSFAFPHIHYRLNIDGSEVLNIPRAASFMERVSRAVPGSHAEIRFSSGDIYIEGALCHPSHAQSESLGLCILVNSRLVSDKAIARAIRDAFGGTLKPRQYPLGVLHLCVPHEFVDVNVHPQKSEVRFQSSGIIFKAVHEAVREALRAFSGPRSFSSAPQLANAPRQPHGAAGLIGQTGLQGQTALSLWAAESEARSDTALLDTALSSQASERFSALIPSACNEDNFTGAAFRFSELTYLGQVFECYLLCSGPGGFYCIDMHAAHERYNYNLIRNRLRQRLSGAQFPSQVLLYPLEVGPLKTGAFCTGATSGDGLWGAELQAMLERIGFSLELTRSGTVRIHSAPALFRQSELAAIIREVADILEEENDSTEEQLVLNPALDGRIDTIAARLACHASIRSGKMLSRDEVAELFKLLDSAEFSSACPHGRPVCLQFTKSDFENWFGRVG